MTEDEKKRIALCIKGDRKAQLALYESLFGRLMSVAKRYFQNRDDCKAHVNAAFFKILEKLPQYSGEGAFEAWCGRIMTNTLIDEWRKEKKSIRVMSHDQIPEDNIDLSTFNEAEARLGEEEVREMLFRLPDATRYVFNLFAMEGYSHKEIAELAGISEGTSRWHVNDARRMLKALILKKLDSQ